MISSPSEPRFAPLAAMARAAMTRVIWNPWAYQDFGCGRVGNEHVHSAPLQIERHVPKPCVVAQREAAGGVGRELRGGRRRHVGRIEVDEVTAWAVTETASKSPHWTSADRKARDAARSLLSSQIAGFLYLPNGVLNSPFAFTR